MKKSDFEMLNKAYTHKQAVELLTGECQGEENKMFVYDAKEYAATYKRQSDCAAVLKKSAPHIHQIINSETNEYIVVFDFEKAELFRKVNSKDKKVNASK